MTDSFMVITALIQGLTEFLPVSSSAHLEIIRLFHDHNLTKNDQLMVDIACHGGSLMAIALYMWRDCINLLRVKQLIPVIVGFVPIVIVGIFICDYIEAVRTPMMLGITSIVFGILLWWADRIGHKDQNLDLKRAGGIGLGQCLALIPGVSRSGICMTVGRMMGMSRTDCAKFAFLLAIPVLSAVMGKGFLDIYNGDIVIPVDHIIQLVGISFIASLICIHVFLKIISKIGFGVFAVYRVVLGIMILSMV